MSLHKKMPLWQKLRIRYEYHWMDTAFRFDEPIAPPTWFLTHNAKQIERRIASYNAMMEKENKEKEILIEELKQLLQKKQSELREHERRSQ